MKTVSILEDVSIPNMPGFTKGQEVNVKDEIADILVDRGHAKLHLGKSQDQVQKERVAKSATTEKPEVTVSKKDFHNN